MLLGIISMVQSCSANRTAEEANEIAKQSASMEKFKSTAKFFVTHNQSLDTPSISIVNDSEMMLTEPPIIEYAVLVPSKIYWLFNGDETPSNGDMVVTSYSYIPFELLKERQEPSTRGTIKTIELPVNLQAKNDLTSTYDSELIRLDENISLKVNTLPFVVFICKIKYNEHNSKGYLTETLATTPFINMKTPDSAYEDILRYVKDNKDFHLVGSSDVDNAYIEINSKIFKSLNQNRDLSAFRFMGGSDDGYNCILRYLGEALNPKSQLVVNSEKNGRVDIPDNYREICQEMINSYLDQFSQWSGN